MHLLECRNLEARLTAPPYRGVTTSASGFVRVLLNDRDETAPSPIKPPLAEGRASLAPF
jgi:hypothetical protein